jgi:hypothetical protein
MGIGRGRRIEQTAVYNAIDLSLTVYQLTTPSGFNATRGREGHGADLPVTQRQASPGRRQRAITSDLAPTNYASCVGTGTARARTNWLGSPYDADGTFYAASKTRMTDISDGTSDTVGASESILGEGAESGTAVTRADIEPETIFVSL